MVREDVIAMAREAGYTGYDSQSERLHEFAKLIYEATFRDANLAASRTVIDAAVLHEREACAKVCEELERANLYGVKECAAAIRARSNT